MAMDIPKKSSKRWSNKDVQRMQRQERARASAGASPGSPADARPGREYQGAGMLNKQGRFGSSRSPQELSGRGPTAGNKKGGPR